MSDTLKIYWSPSNFTKEDEQWNFLFHEPIPIANDLSSRLHERAPIIQCPAFRQTLRNVYSLQSTTDDDASFEQVDFNELARPGRTTEIPIQCGSKVSFYSPRSPSITEHINLSYNLGWFFYSEEPVKLKLRAPYFPASSPIESALFSPGEFDISQWFRPVNIDWHIPISSKAFKVSQGQSLAYVEFETDKNIEFIRFQNTNTLTKLSREFISSPTRYKGAMKLVNRYKMAQRSGVMNMVQSEILKNVV